MQDGNFRFPIARLQTIYSCIFYVRMVSCRKQRASAAAWFRNYSCMQRKFKDGFISVVSNYTLCVIKTGGVFMNKYKLIAFDLDGTFLTSEKKITEENLRAVTYAAERGLEIVPATGRLYKGLPEQLRTLPFVRYCILVNGAKVYDAKEDRVISRAELSAGTALALMAHGREIGAFYDAYIHDHGYMDREMYDRLGEVVPDSAYVNYMRTIRTPVDDLTAYIAEHTDSVQKVQYFFSDLEARARELERMPVLFPEVKTSSSISHNVEINAVDAGKGPALRALCASLGFSSREAIAFGDGLNDLDMITEAGMGVAMANGEEAVRKSADLVTCSNDEDGVAKAIYELLG